MKYIILSLSVIASVMGDVDFSARSRNFSIELVHFTQLQVGGHVVISPFGIWTLMTGISLGTAGESYEQLARTFLLPADTNSLIRGYKNLTETVMESKSADVTLTSKNFLFLANDFQINPEFEKVINNDFNANTKALDFKNPQAAAETANDLIKSSGGVTNVLTSEDFAQSRMLLTNVISFKGLWSSPFNVSDTKIEPFYNERREVIGEVNMMYQRVAVPFSNVRNLKAFVIELTYGSDDKYSMLFILPYPNNKVINVYKRLALVSLSDIYAQLEHDIEEYGVDDIDIKIPRFQISTNVVLNKPLNDMGVYNIFEPDLANFTKITNEKIFVSAIVHKAEIEVTESGTVALASSTAVFSDRKPTTLFQANKPFIYFVMEKTTKTVIFGGIYSKPTVY